MDTPSLDTVASGAQVDTAAAGDPQAGALNLGAPAAQTPTDKPQDGGNEPKADAKPDEGKKADDKPAGAPEAYEAFTLPEGFTLDEQMLGEFTPLLKELNLPQEAAQKVIDFAPKLIEKTVQQTAAKVLDEVGLGDRASWSQAVQTDKEIGGEKLAENIAFANKAVQMFGSDALKAMFLKTGVGAHPELVKAFVRIGKQISDDSFVPGGKTTTVANPAVRMYDKSNMNP